MLHYLQDNDSNIIKWWSYHLCYRYMCDILWSTIEERWPNDKWYEIHKAVGYDLIIKQLDKYWGVWLYKGIEKRNKLAFEWLALWLSGRTGIGRLYMRSILSHILS